MVYKEFEVSGLLSCLLKFIYSEKATKFCEIFTLFLSYVVPVKSKVKISQNFVAFLEYMNFKGQLISKGLFVFNSPTKRMKQFCPSRLGQKFEFSS